MNNALIFSISLFSNAKFEMFKVLFKVLLFHISFSQLFLFSKFLVPCVSRKLHLDSYSPSLLCSLSESNGLLLTLPYHFPCVISRHLNGGLLVKRWGEFLAFEALIFLSLVVVHFQFA